MPKTVDHTGNHLVYSYQGMALISKNAAKVIKLSITSVFRYFRLWVFATLCVNEDAPANEMYVRTKRYWLLVVFLSGKLYN